MFVDKTLATSAKLRETGRNAKKQKTVTDQVIAAELLNLWMEEASCR